MSNLRSLLYSLLQVGFIVLIYNFTDLAMKNILFLNIII